MTHCLLNIAITLTLAAAPSLDAALSNITQNFCPFFSAVSPCLCGEITAIGSSILQNETVDPQSSPDESVASGRDALDRRWSGYPWYDAEADGLKPMKIEKPAEETPKTYSDPNFPAALAGLLKWLLWTVIVVVLGVIVFFLVRTFWTNRDLNLARRAKTTPDDDDHRRRIEALPFPVQAAKRDFLAEARRFYQQGQYGEAVKYLFSYQLVQLDKHRLVRLTRGKTNRQYLRELVRHNSNSLAVLVEPTMLAFEDFFFGNHAIDRMRFESIWSRLPEFETQLAGRNSA